MRHVPEAYEKLPERLKTGPLPPPPFQRFDPERLELGRQRHGSTIRARVTLRGSVKGRLKTTDRWMRVAPEQVQGRDVPLEVTVYTAQLGMGGRHAGAVLFEGAQGNERMGVEVEVEPARMGCWTMPLVFLLTLGSVLPLAGLAMAGVLWAIFLSTPRHERAALWVFTVSATLLALVSSAVTGAGVWYFQFGPGAH